VRAILTGGTQIHCVGSPHLTGGTQTQCEGNPHRRHADTLWAVRTSQETQIHCGQSVPHRRHADTLCGQSVPHRKHRYTVGSPYLTGNTQIHCVAECRASQCYSRRYVRFSVVQGTGRLTLGLVVVSRDCVRCPHVDSVATVELGVKHPDTNLCVTVT
jgi:hypothetical protein